MARYFVVPALQGRARIVEAMVWHSDQTPYLSTRFNCDNDLSNNGVALSMSPNLHERPALLVTAHIVT
jgi:hypothetical protein